MLAAIVFPGCLVGSTVAQDSPAPEKKYRGLICRGVEEGGAFLIGQLGFGPHLVSLFSTGAGSASRNSNSHNSRGVGE